MVYIVVESNSTNKFRENGLISEMYLYKLSALRHIFSEVIFINTLLLCSSKAKFHFSKLRHYVCAGGCIA